MAGAFLGGQVLGSTLLGIRRVAGAFLGGQVLGRSLLGSSLLGLR